MNDSMRIIDLINAASEHLAKSGFDNPRLEVELMLGALLGLSRVKLYMEFDRPLEAEHREAFREMYKRRLAREPLQYIIGSTGFRDIELKTDGRALIPRPETEILVQEAVAFLKNHSEPVFADLGTGSGAIAVSLLFELSESRAVALDISDDALLLALENARRIGVEKRISFVNGDMLTDLQGRGPFDAILSNPPYVRSDEIEGLQPEVRDYEPRTALDGGADGLDYLLRIVDIAHEYLKEGGLVLLECDSRQADLTAEKFEKTGRYSHVSVIKDLAGEKRLVKAVLAR